MIDIASLKNLLYDLRRIAEHREQLSEKRIKAIYDNLTKSLNSFVAEQYAEYADEDGRLYVASLDKERKRAWFLNEIINNVDGITPALEREIMSLIDDTFSKCYTGMVAAIQKAETSAEVAKIAKTLRLQPDVLTQAVNNNISKLTLPRVLEKNRAEVIYQIQQELTIGLINGDRYDQMAKRISERVGVSRSKANNIVRTETHRNIESGLMEGAEHVSQDFEEEGLIYAATWRTRKDEKVRPQQRRKTKRGWRTYFSKNGANHIKMEGVTIKVGDKFDLGGGVKAKCPSQSGVAAHDCNCRCFIEYNIMTVEEFVKATGKNITVVSMRKETRQLMNDSGIVDLGLERTTNVDQFDTAIISAKKANANGACVDTHPKAELETYKLFLAKDSMSGVAVKPDGDITAVFKNSNSKAKGAVNDLIITARANGGDKMDCYGQFLVNSYEKCGYTAVARVPFNADYVDDAFLLKTQPDVYIMMKNTDSIEEVISKNAARAYKTSSQLDLDSLPTFEDYDEALKYRDDLLSKQG